MASPPVLSADAVVPRARRLVSADRRVLIGIAGPPGAGKSTLAEQVATALGDCVVVPMDGFHLAQAELVRLDRAERKGAPDTFDVCGYVALLRRLRDRTEEVVYAPTFRRDLEEPIANSLAVPASVGLVITEGNYLLLDEPGWRDARAHLDEVWYVDLPDDIRHRRLVQRRREHAADEAEAWRWTLGSDERNAQVVMRTRARADVVVRDIEER